MRIFLSGPMGTGKSTVAREVARARGLAFVDLDATIADAEGASISDIFATRGERAFRDLEAVHVQRLLATRDAIVVALGGGTVTRESTRRLLLERGVLISLRAPVEVLVQRLRGDQQRPLLKQGDMEQTLRALLDERRQAYAECHAVLDATEPPERVATRVLQVAERDPIAVALGERTYEVSVGDGVLQELGSRLSALSPPPSRVVLVTDAHVDALHGGRVRDALGVLNAPVTTVALEAGEAAKHIGSVQRIWDAALRDGVDRDALVVGLGGGVVGDLAGFAAATILRGIRLVHVPTTLLAMVDSAIGGKTGFDTAQGKNLIGAFHQPHWVVSDVQVLATLPIEERRAGLAEVVKSAWLDGETAVEQLERDAQALQQGETQATLRAVRMAARLKARVVSGDEREGGARALLNLGHTVGHAIEASLGYQGMRHGEAVALGMVAACRLATTLGRDPAHMQRMIALLQALGLPTDVDRFLDPATLAFMAADKKRGAGKLKYIVPGAPGATEVMALALDDIARRVVKP